MTPARSASAYGSGRERLLDAALKMFAAGGFDGVSIRDIGREAGLTNPALYRHFAGKEELGIELFRRCYERVVKSIEDAAQAEAAPLDKVAAYATAFVDLFERDRAVILYMDENQVRFWPLVRRAFEPRTLSTMVSGWIAAGRRDGSIDTTSSLPVQVALVLGTLTQWAAMRAAGVMNSKQGQEMAAALRHALQSR